MAFHETQIGGILKVEGSIVKYCRKVMGQFMRQRDVKPQTREPRKCDVNRS